MIADRFGPRCGGVVQETTWSLHRAAPWAILTVPMQIPLRLLALLAFAVPWLASAETRRAVVVGIDDYESAGSGAAGRASWSNLDGAVSDAKAMRGLLVEKWGFAAENVVLLTNASATRTALLKALRTQLVEASQPGDVALLYFAGHGSRVRFTTGRVDESIVPSDARAGAADIRDRELQRILHDALDRGARVWTLFDSCHSGGLTRGRKGRARSLPLVEMGGPPPDEPVLAPASSRGAIVMAAAQDSQLAWEAEDAAGRSRGLFSIALEKAMREAAVDESLETLFRRVSAFVRDARAGDEPQDPVLAAPPEAGRRPLFSVAKGSGRMPVPLLSFDGETGRLGAGKLVGLTEGSTLTSGDGAVRVEVTEVAAASSSLRLVSGPRARMVAGLPLFVATVATAAKPDLRVFLAASTDVFGEVQARVPAGVLAPAAEVVQAIVPGQGALARVARGTSAEADYALVSRRNGAVVEHAWMRLGSSALPPNTEWVETPSKLVTQLSSLAAIAGWLALPERVDPAFPYRLAFVDLAQADPKRRFVTAGIVREGRSYALALVATRGQPAPIEPRWIYVFAIWADGSRSLVFPPRETGDVGNELPPARPADVHADCLGSVDARAPLVYCLPYVRIEPAAPFGHDTWVLVATREKLPDPTLLEGRRLRGEPSGEERPLEEWLVQRLSLESAPAKGAGDTK